MKRLTPLAVIAATCVLALLYFGRDVLQPIALASILSLMIAPLVRQLRRRGRLGQMPATLVAVLIAACTVAAIGTVLAFQLAAVAGDLPKYRAAIRTKIEKMREVTERPFARLEAELNSVSPSTPVPASVPAATTKKGVPPPPLVLNPSQPVPVEIRAPKVTTKDAIMRVVAYAWGPVGEAGIVLVLLIFILLEHDSLRDRLVMFAGQSERRRTIKALSDATAGISRFFFSQLVVNVTFGVVLGAGLWVAGIPHAAVFGALAAMLRFVPYLGVMIAAAAMTLFVAAIDPGWQLAVSCLALFLVIEVVVAHGVEPKVYGRSAGMSPLAIIISALFWAAIWGPIGLLLSTPLTLCLVVAGRHVRALETFSTLLGHTTSMSAAERIYQRFLLGDTRAILADARTYLRHSSFARYCDQILLPGLVLAVSDHELGQTDEVQEKRVRATIAEVAATLTPVSSAPNRRARRRDVSLLDANVGAHLRQMREARLGRWQGSLDVAAHSVVLCVGLPSERDDLLTELLVRSLREVGVDARSVTATIPREAPENRRTDLVSTIFLAYPAADAIEQWLVAAHEMRSGLPHALLATIRLPFDEDTPHQAIVDAQVDMVLRSFEEGLAFVLPDEKAKKRGAVPVAMAAAA
ncbi:AI-2E family transporter [Massilia sp. PWRC2]|uniref:AI-2E family transporter n=1 Tax=Massilia sp. PWRC2 TaxID=2804626 RepID=UPI003CEDE17C